MSTPTPENTVRSVREPVNIDREFNPVVAEVIRRRLYNIAEEMGSTMIRTSGNQVIAESKDFSTFVATPGGEMASFSAYLSMHAATSREAVQYIQESVPDEQINPGDQFLCNDPFTTGISHQPDIGILKPVFHDDELVAWCWSQAHMLDVGGVEAGGFAPSAEEAYAESIRFPGVKIVEEGTINEDIEAVIKTNVRLADRVFNDVRALIAGNNRGEERLHDTISEFGLETYKKYLETNKDLTRAAVEKRLRELPDGTFDATQHIEHDGQENRLYEINLDLIVDGGTLLLDFSESSEQAPGFINGSRGGSLGCAMTPLMLVLAPDIPPNEGLFEAVDVDMPSGTVLNAEAPAPASGGHTESGLAAMKAVMKALNRAMAQAEDEYVRQHAMSPGLDAWPVCIYQGFNQYGQPDVFLDMNGGGIGGGASTVNDGVDARGTLVQLNNSVPDVETTEREHPALYLWRRLNRNSSGAGRMRGGNGVDFAYALHDVEGGQLTVTNACTQVPVDGASGGYPGATNVAEVIRGSDIDTFFEDDRVPDAMNDLSGDREELPAKQIKAGLDGDAIVRLREGGGSGLGDPLQRDPNAVSDDVQNGYITDAQARDIYGVVIDEGDVDAAATETRRDEIRAERRAWTTEETLTRAVPDSTVQRPLHLGANIVSDGEDRFLQCRHCESVFAPFEGSDDRGWLDYTGASQTAASDRMAELQIPPIQEREEDDQAYLREYACPDCGTLLETDVVIE
jgi:N-methylhydantoinase B